jgi:hypothetical protein
VRSSSETISVESICNFDDTLPLPAEVETEYREKAGDDLTALAWLSDHGIDSAPQQHVALIQYGMAWNPETGRYLFLIYAPEHVGPKHPPELAIPIYEDGNFVDLLFISDEQSFARATCRAKWLGSIAGPVLRLHAHPMDWLKAGCTGVCHIEPISRKALAELTDATTIECNCIHTALEAWDWAFGGDPQELARFEIDATPESVSRHIESEIQWRVLSRLRHEGLPIGPNPLFCDPNFAAQIEKMQSEYVYAGDASETESHP